MIMIYQIDIINKASLFWVFLHNGYNIQEIISLLKMCKRTKNNWVGKKGEELEGTSN